MSNTPDQGPGKLRPIHTESQDLGRAPRRPFAINSESLPGAQQAEWPSLVKPDHAVPSASEWQAMPLQQRVAAERQAATAYLEKKSPEYRASLMELSREYQPIDSERFVQVVIPAYNEDQNITGTLNALAKQVEQYEQNGKTPFWGVTIVVNRPLTDDAEKSAIDQQKMEKTISEIEKFQSSHPQMHLDFVVLEAPQDIAGVGLARMVGHDLVAARSIQNDEGQRKLPLFIQTMDADTQKLREDYFETIERSLKSTDMAKDVYREAACFPASDLARYPLLDSLDFFWTESIRALSENTEQPWTAGAGILVSLYSHTSAGGVFPFKFDRGVDEDLRIGYHALALRDTQESLAQIENPLFETDPRRFVIVAGDLLKTMQEQDLFEGPKHLIRDYRAIVTGLKTYLDFHSAEIRGKDSPVQTDPGWIFSREEFERALPVRALEVVANAYKEFIREELSMDRGSRINSEAAEIYERFKRGEQARGISAMQYAEHESALVERIRAGESSSELTQFSEMLREVDEISTRLIVGILEKHGFEARVHESDYLPKGGSEESEIPWPIEITSTEGYRERLKNMVYDGPESH